MTKGATRWREGKRGGGVLHVAFELDDQGWKVAFGTRLGKRPWLRRVSPRDREGILGATEAAKGRFGLDEDAWVVSCYEAGREGFWLHRWLEAEGIRNRVVDSSSIEVNRRARRAKTDRLDAKKLLRQLMRHEAGERTVRWMAVQIAWAWLHHQPDSELSRWYNRRFGQGGRRMKKVGVVALVRKLVTELWRYVETGALPEGATLKA